MSEIRSIADPEHVKNQYRNTSFLNARFRLYQEFSTNKYGWQRWLFDQCRFPLQGRILELGCGTGDLWLENLDRIPDGLDVVLSDLSPGILQQTWGNPRDSRSSFQFGIIDAQSIPFDDQCFEIVIANHMLYHVPDGGKVLLEVQRVMRWTGRFYASTIGKDHLKELGALVSKFDSRLSSWGQLPSGSFDLENGSAQLGEHFGDVSLHRYADSLTVTDAGVLTDYIASGLKEITSDRYSDLAMFVEQELQANDGQFHITKDWGG